MAPGVIRNQCQLLVLSLQFAQLVEVERLGISHERLYGCACYFSLTEYKLWILIKQRTHDVEIVVGMLGTIDQWTTFHTHHATVGLYLVICTDGAWLHVEMYLHFVALLPLAANGIVTILRQLSCYLLSIHLHGIAQTFVVGILIEIAGYDLIFHPSRDANLHGKLSDSILIYRYHNIAIPRIFSGLTQGNILSRHAELALV